jgi:hypothetical protein
MFEQLLQGCVDTLPRMTGSSKCGGGGGGYKHLILLRFCVDLKQGWPHTTFPTSNAAFHPHKTLQFVSKMSATMSCSHKILLSPVPFLLSVRTFHLQNLSTNFDEIWYLRLTLVAVRGI